MTTISLFIDSECKYQAQNVSILGINKCSGTNSTTGYFMFECKTPFQLSISAFYDSFCSKPLFNSTSREQYSQSIKCYSLGDGLSIPFYSPFTCYNGNIVDSRNPISSFDTGSQSGISGGVIAGIVVGVLAFLAVVSFAVYKMYKNRLASRTSTNNKPDLARRDGAKSAGHDQTIVTVSNQTTAVDLHDPTAANINQERRVQKVGIEFKADNGVDNPVSRDGGRNANFNVNVNPASKDRLDRLTGDHFKADNHSEGVSHLYKADNTPTTTDNPFLITSADTSLNDTFVVAGSR
jgi:hypothetical protein